MLLYKIDSQFFYIKNTHRSEPIIKIPIHRATVKQRHIKLQGSEDFNTSMTEIGKTFSKYGNVDWKVGRDWFLDDYGYFLKFQRKQK